MSKKRKIAKSIVEMIDEIRKTQGAYEAKRLERAADEVPNLERLYQPEALQGLFTGDNAKGIMTMRPGDFERYATPLDYDPKSPKHFMFGEAVDPVKGSTPKGLTQEQYIQYLSGLKGFENVPFLEVNKTKSNELAITGHEGRHRNRALEMSGQPSSLVQFLPRASLREPFPRRSREEYIQALNEEMSRYANMVRPQQEGPDRRPLIKLPDVYKGGGPVHKQDGGAATYNEPMLRRTGKFSQASLDQMRREMEENARRIAAEKQARLDNPPPAEMTEYNPTLQQRLGSATERGLKAVGATTPRARALSDVLTGGRMGSPLPLGMSVMDFTPVAIPVYGGQGVMNAAEAAGKGNYGEAALELGLAGLDLSAAYPATKALVKAAKPMVKAGAKALAPKLGETAEQYMFRTGMALPLDVWHGSPHRFPPAAKNPLGEFDPTKIGTGEGAQAYGHGHYLAEAPKVAKRYVPRDPDYEDKLMRMYKQAERKQDYASMEVLENALIHKTPEELRELHPEHGTLIDKIASIPQKGSLYKVDLPDEQIAKMLDWDKPLSEQSKEARDALAKWVDRLDVNDPEKLRLVDKFDNPKNQNIKFGQLYNEATSSLWGKDTGELSRQLQQSGIPGIKYFDEASRDAGEGTRNFVVFPGGEEMLTIKERMKDGGLAEDEGRSSLDVSLPPELMKELIDSDRKAKAAEFSRRNGMQEMPRRSGLRLTPDMIEFDKNIKGFAGRATYDIPVGKYGNISPYVGGFVVKPKGMDAMGRLTNAGITYTDRFKDGGKVKNPVSIDAMRLAVGGAATSNEAMLRRERRLGKVDKPVSISPKQLARGWAAGTLGLPGDIESLGRMVIPGASEDTFLPTSEDMLKKIPGAATDEVGQRAAQVGTLFGGAGAGRIANAIRHLPTDVMRAATAAYGPQATASHIFIGWKSPLWNVDAGKKAVELEKAGVAPVDIWKQTGTFRSPDGALRQEISDVGSKFRGEKEMKELVATMKQQEADIKQKIKESKEHPDLFPKQLKTAQGALRQAAKEIKQIRTMEGGPEYRVGLGNKAGFAFEHPELYEAYPKLLDMDVQQGGRSGSALGSYTRGIDESDPGMVNIYDRGLANDPRSTMIHEAQHAIQNIEGWGRGGNTAMAFQNPEAHKILENLRNEILKPMTYEEFFDKFKGSGIESMSPSDAIKHYELYKQRIPEKVKQIDRELQSQAAQLYYERLAGEAESRAAQARRDLTPEQRLEKFPLEVNDYGYDVKPEDIIVKRNKKGGQVSLDAMRLAVQNKANGGAATSNEAMLRRERRLGKVDKPVSISPKQLARGWAAGTVGMPGDIEALGRLLLEDRSVMAPIKTRLPTSEDVLKIIPGEAEDEVGKRAADVGTLFGGAGVALGGKLAAKGAKAIAPKLGEAAEEYMFRTGMALPAVPPSRSVEEATKLFEAAQKTRSKAAQIEAGLYHPIGGGAKLSKPVELMSFKAVDDPSVSMKPKRFISPEEMQGAVAIPLIGDRAAAGKILTDVGDIKLSKPVKLQGGFGHMQVNPDPWASGEEVISRLSNLTRMAADLGRTDKVYAPTVSMSPTGVDFNAMVAQTVLGQYDPSSITKKAKKEFLDDIRNYVPDKKKPHIKPGSVLTEADLNEVEALREKMLLPNAGPLRKAFVERLGIKKFQNMGFPDVAASRVATTAPELLNINYGLTGHNIARLDPEGRIIKSPIMPNESYPVHIGGEYFGSLDEPISYKDFFSGFSEQSRLFGRPESQIFYTFGKQLPIQQLDQEWLDRVMKLMGKDRPREWKKGGPVHKATGGMASVPLKMMRAFVEAGKKAKLAEKSKEAVAKGEVYIPDEETKKAMREALNMPEKPEEYADGGQITSDDLILEERAL